MLLKDFSVASSQRFGSPPFFAPLFGITKQSRILRLACGSWGEISASLRLCRRRWSDIEGCKEYPTSEICRQLSPVRPRLERSVSRECFDSRSRKGRRLSGSFAVYEAGYIGWATARVGFPADMSRLLMNRFFLSAVSFRDSKPRVVEWRKGPCFIEKSL